MALSRASARRRPVPVMWALAAALLAGPQPAVAFFGPVIAMLTEPLTTKYTPDAPPGSFLTAWYVKWVQAYGGRVVPLRYDAPDWEVDAVLARVNGVLFPGGGVDIGSHDPYGRFSKRVFEAVQKMRMPLWGTCLGFEQFLLYSSGEDFPGPLSMGWQSMPLFAPLNLTQPEPEDSFLADWPESVKKEAGQKPWTWHMHVMGVSTEDFARRPVLQDFWKVLATNVDHRGKEFVSIVQARNGLPIYATQFHPEKNAHEWEVPYRAPVNGALPVHAAGAIGVSNRFAEFFVEQARGFRGFKFSDTDFWKASISNWPLRHAGEVKGLEWAGKHMEVYYFPQWQPPKGSPPADLLV